MKPKFNALDYYTEGYDDFEDDFVDFHDDDETEIDRFLDDLFDGFEPEEGEWDD